MGSNFNHQESLAESVEINSGAKVDLNSLMKRVKDEEKRSKRQNIAISAAALSAVAVFGIILLSSFTDQFYLLNILGTFRY